MPAFRKIKSLGRLVGCGALLIGGLSAQLNENCVVSVLNRTVQVRPDGTWVLPNIPANFGAVRARATCVENGVTRSGESAPFTLASNGSVDVPKIVLGPVTPIPAELVVTAAKTQLTQANESVQLTVTGRYADSSTKNLTAPSTGTTYLISNPAIASITAGGVVTARTSGTVLVQAQNEGTTGLLSISVVLTRDSDGDGILDDIEIANGLNPNNAADAAEDPDQDGLNNREEIVAGTQLRDADTDKDGLKDGAEVKTHRTNPLLPDTDNDGVPDAIEITSGSDPLNPASRNLAVALSRIRVTPETFVINVNDVQGIAFQQLTVTGDFKAGGTINLTARAQGTNYSSSNLQVCNFGAEDGRVFGSQDGTCRITVTNAGFTAVANGTVRNFSPVPLSFINIPGFANNVDVSGDYAYIAAGFSGLQIVSVSDRSSPQIVGSVDTAGNANDVVVLGNLAYVADGASGLQVINIASPTAPVIVGSFDTPGDASDVFVTRNTAYIADGSGGLQIVDVTNPSSPQRIGSLALAGLAKGVAVDASRNLAVIAAGGSGLHIVDISNKAAPALRATLPGGDVRDVTLSGNYAFLADFQRSFTTVDLTNPSTPVLRQSTQSNLGGLLMDVAVSGQFAAGADVLFVNGVPLIDVSNPASPLPRSIIDFRSFSDDNGTGIAMDGSYVYLTADAGGGIENGVSGSTRLYIGQYIARQDLLGVPPVVSIVSPAQNGTAIEGSTLPIVVTAVDDVAVAAVQFLINGQVAFTDTSAPYEFPLSVPAGSFTIGVRAVDLGGNTGTAPATRTITVIPDPGTTVTGRVVGLNTQPLSGATVSAFSTFTSTTAADGRFSISRVPTVRGNIIVTAQVVVSGTELRGASAPVVPVPGGMVDAGTIVARSGRKVAIMAADLAPWIDDVRNKLMSTGLFTHVDTYNLAFTATPTVAQMQQYDALLVYSDYGFSNATALGNNLADYADSGGGVVVATFAFWSGNALGVDGRFRTGNYLPFTTAGQSQPGGLTLLKVLPQHPILAGVNTFNGGTSSFHNASISIAPGTTLVASWSNGQPLVGVRQTAQGRVAGLNFFPPSSTVRGDFWVASTDGALLLGNALFWAAR